MLKDWKKFKEEYPELYIWHNENKEKNLGIDDNKETEASNSKFKYNVFLDEDYGAKVIKAFKTKSQALSFAKSYMRKH